MASTMFSTYGHRRQGVTTMAMAATFPRRLVGFTVDSRVSSVWQRGEGSGAVGGGRESDVVMSSLRQQNPWKSRGQCACDRQKYEQEEIGSERRRRSSKNAEGLDVRLARRLRQTVSERQLLRPEQRVLVAVSGGQDSVCLMHLLMRLQSEWGWKVGIAHCDHQWSSASRQQAAHVAQMAQSANLDYYQALTTRSVLGEGLARTWRYGVLQRIAIAHGYEVIVTAHTASDRIETLLYNLFRGTGLHGLQSLTWKRLLSPVLCLSRRSAFQPDRLIDSFEDPHLGTVDISPQSNRSLELVRPLLDVTRSELRELRTQLELPLWPDPSNHSMDIDRNRIRHQLLPYVRKHFNAGIDKSLARWAEILYGEEVYLDNLCRSILSKAETELHGSELGKQLDVSLLRSLPIALQRRVLKQFTDGYTGKSLGFDLVERLRQAACSHGSRALQMSIRGGYYLRLQDNFLIVARDQMKDSRQSLTVGD